MYLFDRGYKPIKQPEKHDKPDQSGFFYANHWFDLSSHVYHMCLIIGFKNPSCKVPQPIPAQSVEPNSARSVYNLAEGALLTVQGVLQNGDNFIRVQLT